VPCGRWIPIPLRGIDDGTLAMTPKPTTARSPDCEEKQELLNAYSRAVHRYSIAVEALSLARSKAPLKDYQRMRRMSERARAKVEEARLNLEAHIAEHCC
jgi:hypothetical protein